MQPEAIIDMLRQAADQRQQPQITGPYQQLAGLIEAHVIGSPYFDRQPAHTLTDPQWVLLRHGLASLRDSTVWLDIRRAADRLHAALIATAPAAVSTPPPAAPGQHFTSHGDHAVLIGALTDHSQLTITVNAPPETPLPFEGETAAAADHATTAHTVADTAPVYDVFLSYAHADDKIRRRVENFLVQQGFTVFCDHRAIPAGDPDWGRTIEQAIQGSLLVVVIQTPAAAQSEWVRRELTFAEQHNVSIIPLLAGDERRSQILSLVNRQRIDLRTDHNGGLRQLLRALQTRWAGRR